MTRLPSFNFWVSPIHYKIASHYFLIIAEAPLKGSTNSF